MYGGLTNNGDITTPSDVNLLHWNGTSAWDNLGRDNASSTTSSVSVLGVTAFSPFTLGSTSQVLAVSFINFSGVRSGAATTLHWTAIADNEIKGYSVERSADGRVFSSIGFVSSSVSGVSGAYNYVDNNSVGKVYYRLRTVTAGGDSKLSTVLLMNENTQPIFSIESLYPNPVVNTLNIQLQTPAKRTISLQLTDASGRIVLQKTETLQAGINSLQATTALLPNGVFLLQISSDKGERSHKRFSKQ